MAPASKNAVVNDILADLAKDSKPSPVQYLRDGDTTIKLVLPAGRTDVRGFYQRFMATFKQEQFPYYLVAGVIVQADEDGVADAARVRYIKVTKSILMEIANLIAKRWKLFEDDGSLIVITKGKKSGKVAYNVVAIPETYTSYLQDGNAERVVPALNTLPMPEISIEEAAADQEESSASRDETGGDSSETIK